MAGVVRGDRGRLALGPALAQPAGARLPDPEAARASPPTASRGWRSRDASRGGGGPRDPDQFRADFHALLELLREHKIHPVVAERLPLSEARHAHEMLGRAAAKGKLVLVP
ncbi:zinc-binding dehydrogenase [Streptomyces sp. MUSC 125]|uniref:zinc-binding dehydrogenase n=1 Tax=Streptomyces sp. MUSC 125 TaxID=1428624 RepID=UPI003B640534